MTSDFTPKFPKETGKIHTVTLTHDVHTHIHTGPRGFRIPGFWVKNQWILGSPCTFPRT